MSIETWFLFLAVSILPAISPGPGVLLAISNALRFGAKATLISGLGNAVGLAILGYAVTLGLGALMATSAILFMIIKFIGAGYLVYLGTKLLRDKSALSFTGHDDTPRQSYLRLFTTGLIISVTNPKAIFVIAALFPQFLPHNSFGLYEVSILSFSYAILCYANHAVLAVFGGRMRGFLQSEKLIRRIRKSLGLAFISFGAALATVSR